MPTQLPRSLTALFLLICILSATSHAAPIPAAPKITANGHLLIDFHSGKVLAEANSTEQLEPASLTKIMSAYVVLREIKEGNITLNEEVLISKKAWRTPGSRMFIEVGKKVKLEQLLKGMIIQSGNDASVALAEHVAGNEEVFANLMNEHARRLGMVDSQFQNSTGLPAKEHYTTAADIAKVTMATIREFPEYYAWYSIKEYTFNKITQKNRNKLLWRDESVDGVKTGHTDSAGYCLVSSAIRNDTRLVSVVMGTKSVSSRAKESQTLLNYGFRFFETHRLYGAGEKLSVTRVWKGSAEQLELGLSQPLYITIPRRQYKNLEAKMSITPKIEAPVSKGQVVGQVRISLADNLVAEVPLIALRDIAEGGIWQTIKDSALLMWE